MAERKPVPQGIKIPNRTSDHRQELVREFDKLEGKDWVHVFKSPDNVANQRHMDRFGMSPVEENDEYVKSGDDILCRMPKYVAQGLREASEGESLSHVKQSVTEFGEAEMKKRPLSVKRDPKKESDKIELKSKVTTG